MGVTFKLGCCSGVKVVNCKLSEVLSESSVWLLKLYNLASYHKTSVSTIDFKQVDEYYFNIARIFDLLHCMKTGN